ncbi:MAG: hypothetical protein ABJK59_03555 [Erythrobacter sp.]|uniref:hypothetical protein n=1 Tax=Erythrobacter sp. TaxID=1042 RepID=UPI003298763D
MPPMIYFALAPLFFVLAGVGYFYANQDDARRAFADISKPLAETVHTVELYENGREEALKPLNAGNALLTILLVLAAACGGYGFFRKRSVENQKLEEEQYYQAEDNPTS